MMIVMAGKRVAAAGIFVAAVAATAALWVVPHATPASQLRAVRHAQSAAASSSIVHLSVPVALPTPQSPVPSPVVGLAATGSALFAFLLVGVVRQHRRSAITVTARPPRRGRAPPSPRLYHAARTRNH